MFYLKPLNIKKDKEVSEKKEQNVYRDVEAEVVFEYF